VKATIVVPCYNESARLRPDPLVELARLDPFHLVLVDDGSTDDTRARLASIAARSEGRAHVLALDKNRGKAEAVRRGLRLALDEGAGVAGYLDADLATPIWEVPRLLAELDDPKVEVVLGSRVALLGRHIERSAVRHYLGRVFATVASIGLGLAVYDTQCGAKLFRKSEAFLHALEEPFTSRWAFDVEILGRMLYGPAAIPASSLVEVPLREWCDVPTSKVSPLAMVRSGLELIGISARMRLTARPRQTETMFSAGDGPPSRRAS
jgi:glycosyltransferase involved in cell wall biosynthesis